MWRGRTLDGGQKKRLKALQAQLCDGVCMADLGKDAPEIFRIDAIAQLHVKWLPEPARALDQVRNSRRHLNSSSQITARGATKKDSRKIELESHQEAWMIRLVD